MAVAMRGELTEQVILHADRGCQYNSAAIATLSGRLAELGRAGTMLQLNHSGPQ
jgi:hypothetical protein